MDILLHELSAAYTDNNLCHAQFWNSLFRFQFESYNLISGLAFGQSCTSDADCSTATCHHGQVSVCHGGSCHCHHVNECHHADDCTCANNGTATCDHHHCHCTPA